MAPDLGAVVVREELDWVALGLAVQAAQGTVAPGLAGWGRWEQGWAALEIEVVTVVGWAVPGWEALDLEAEDVVVQGLEVLVMEATAGRRMLSPAVGPGEPPPILTPVQSATAFLYV